MREKKKKEKRRDDNPKNLKTNPRKVNNLKKLVWRHKNQRIGKENDKSKNRLN